MERCGIEKSVVLGFAWSDAETCVRHNDYLLGAAAQSDGRLIPFCMVQPAVGAEAMANEIARCARGGARGLGELRPDDQGFHLVGAPEGQALADLARAHDLVLLFHVTEPAGHAYPGKAGLRLDDFAAFVAAHPGVKIVGAHWGGGLPLFALMPKTRQTLGNTWFDTAASRYLYDPRIYRVVSEIAGADRILFGSDYPLIEQDVALKEVAAAIENPGTRSALTSVNAAGLLGLDQ
jgi:predicted TIM-barrel fold metal-dependent hydrolase